MKFKKPIIVVLGEPYSVFIEIFFKTYQNFIKNKIMSPIILIGSYELLVKQMKYFKYNFKFNLIDKKSIDRVRDNKRINVINVNYKFHRIFEKTNKFSNNYISECFKISIKLVENNKVSGIVNGPINKKKFLNKKYLGITEYLAHQTNTKNISMLIYNKDFSVSPITTHVPLKKVVSNLTRGKIIKNISLLNNFYRKKLKLKPKIAVLGLNPHCETNLKTSEEKKLIIPAIKFLKKKSFNISGPYPTDTFFIKENIKNFDLVIGMYHDQVLTPLKTLYEFDAINITVGLPFIRISPDHGPNEKMVSKGKSDNISLIKCLKFLENI